MKYSRDQSNSLSLKVYDKEIAFVEEDSRRKKTLVLTLMKVREMEPNLYKPIDVMLCIATELTSFQVFAYSLSTGEKLLISDLKDIVSSNGFTTAVRTSINMLRYALTWATALNPLNLIKTMQEN